jgi:hypothetical protein
MQQSIRQHRRREGAGKASRYKPESSGSIYLVERLA